MEHCGARGHEHGHAGGAWRRRHNGNLRRSVGEWRCWDPIECWGGAATSCAVGRAGRRSCAGRRRRREVRRPRDPATDSDARDGGGTPPSPDLLAPASGAEVIAAAAEADGNPDVSSAAHWLPAGEHRARAGGEPPGVAASAGTTAHARHLVLAAWCWSRCRLSSLSPCARFAPRQSLRRESTREVARPAFRGREIETASTTSARGSDPEG